MANFLVLLNTTPQFRGPPLLKALKDACGEEPVAAWASETTFGMFVAADMSPGGIYRAIVNAKPLVTSILVLEVGPRWAHSQTDSRAAGWLQGHLGRQAF